MISYKSFLSSSSPSLLSLSDFDFYSSSCIYESHNFTSFLISFYDDTGDGLKNEPLPASYVYSKFFSTALSTLLGFVINLLLLLYVLLVFLFITTLSGDYISSSTLYSFFNTISYYLIKCGLKLKTIFLDSGSSSLNTASS